jgi:hypothetical protein
MSLCVTIGCCLRVLPEEIFHSRIRAQIHRLPHFSLELFSIKLHITSDYMCTKGMEREE